MDSKTKDNHTAFYWCCTIIFTLFACYQTYLATAWGAGLTTDSLSYLEGARSILKNGDLSGLGSHWPPLYFLLIALCSSLVHDLLAATKWLQIVTMAVNVLLLAFILYKVTEKSLIASFIGTIIFATSSSVLLIHSMAWTEAFFCLLALLGFYFLAEYIQRKEKIYFLVVSACFIGLAFMTRYAGITLILTAVTALFLWGRKKNNQRIVICIFFSLISSMPMLLWMVRNMLVDNVATDRVFVFHPVPMQKILFGLSVLSSWLCLPEKYPVLLLGISLLLLVGYSYSLKALSGKKRSLNRLLEISFIFVLIYILFIVFSISFFDAHTPLDQRILYPVYVFFFLGVVLLYNRLSLVPLYSKASILLLLLLLFLSFKQYSGRQNFLSNAIENGLGFANRQWVRSDMLHWLNNSPSTTVIYTNGPDPITIYTGRKSIMLPRHTDPISRQKNEKFDAELDMMGDVLAQKKGVIIYFYSITWRWYLPTLNDLRKKFSLHLVYQGKDGAIVSVQLPTDHDK